MKTIIAGSRTCTDYRVLQHAITQIDWTITTVISGTARGADQLGEFYAERYGIPIERYPAQWEVHGRSAGYKRNELMATKAEALIALWDGQSRGTQHMIHIAKRYGLKIHVHKY